MGRSNSSARAAGSSFERLIADDARDSGFENADRMVKRGIHDAGDITGVYFGPHKVCLELKNATRTDLPKWYGELEVEKENLQTGYGAVVWKRHGKGKADEQNVSMTWLQFKQYLAAMNEVCKENDALKGALTVMMKGQ